jgi:hypothetical protein
MLSPVHLEVEMRVVALAAFLACVVIASPVSGTTNLALAFGEIVQRAGVIFRAEVTAQRAEWRTRGGSRAIVTIVDFHVERALKGAVESVRRVEFLGGRIGDQQLVVYGMPQFKVGDRDIVCLRDVAEVFPIVGGAQGRFRVVRGADTIERVMFADGTPVPSVGQVGRARILVSPTPLAAVRVDVFESAILEEVRRGRR